MQVTEPRGRRPLICAMLMLALGLPLAGCGNQAFVRDVYMGVPEPAQGGAAVPRDELGNPILEAPRRRFGWW